VVLVARGANAGTISIFSTAKAPPADDLPVNHDPQPESPLPPSAVSRRDLISGGLLLGAGFLLAGCRSRGGTREGSLPEPLWPDKHAAIPSIPSPPPGPLPGPTTEIIPRSAWASGGLRNSGQRHLMNGVRRITIHHTAMDASGLQGTAEIGNMLDRIRKEHLRRDSRVVDIGYHFIIDPQGRVWAGRSTMLQGAHVKDKNEHNLGICVMGNFEVQHPTPAQVRTLNTFVPTQMRRYNVHTSQLFTHRELGESACPGASLQQIMREARSRGGLFASL
jgi:N-acetylmuramoyl-L-alanine amidase